MTRSSERFLLLDWLKVFILIAIQTFHANEFIFFEDDFPLISNSLIYMPAYYYARLFSLGGQGLVSIIYLLFGFSGKSRASLLKISGFAVIGQLILTFAFLKGIIWSRLNGIFISTSRSLIFFFSIFQEHHGHWFLFLSSCSSFLLFSGKTSFQIM